jgi:hypothetical protein
MTLFSIIAQFLGIQVAIRVTIEFLEFSFRVSFGFVALTWKIFSASLTGFRLNSKANGTTLEICKEWEFLFISLKLYFTFSHCQLSIPVQIMSAE